VAIGAGGSEWPGVRCRWQSVFLASGSSFAGEPLDCGGRHLAGDVRRFGSRVWVESRCDLNAVTRQDFFGFVPSAWVNCHDLVIGRASFLGRFFVRRCVIGGMQLNDELSDFTWCVAIAIWATSSVWGNASGANPRVWGNRERGVGRVVSSGRCGLLTCGRADPLTRRFAAPSPRGSRRLRSGPGDSKWGKR
jgi:hypothetical protein